MIRLLRTVLEFETAQRAIAKPMTPASVLIDQRTQHVSLSHIINTLSGASLSPQALAVLASADKQQTPGQPQIIEGETC